MDIETDMNDEGADDSQMPFKEPTRDQLRNAFNANQHDQSQSRDGNNLAVGAGVVPNGVDRRLQFSGEYDGFIGDDSYADLSGDLISIEDTYKEVAHFKKSGQSNDQMKSQASYGEEFKQSHEGLKKSMTVI